VSAEPGPKTRALAAKLFAAARAERPDPALLRRLQMIRPRAAASVDAASVDAAFRETAARELADGRPGARVRSLRAFWLAAAAVLGGAGALWLSPATEQRSISLSPERGRATPRSARPTVGAASPDVSGPSAIEASAPLGNPPPEEKAPKVALPVPRRSAPAAPAADSAPSAGAASAAESEASASSKNALDDLELLKRARVGLRAGAADRALELLDRYARERVDGGVEADATLLRLEALAALGRKGEASRLATRFVRDSPNSVLADRARTFIVAAEPPARDQSPRSPDMKARKESP
jgi:hypothetical protein